jgi:hypothetical protein
MFGGWVMRSKLFRKTVVFFVVAVFALTSGLALAADKPEKKQKAEKQEKQWYVIQTEKGQCRVIQATGKTPKYKAGPFPTEQAADAEKAKICPKKEKPAKQKETPATQKK